MLEIFLITDASQLRAYKRFSDYEFPHPIGDAIAKACHIKHNITGEEVIVVLYPTILKDNVLDVTKVLVHEAVHCWDFIRDTYGYGNDTELNAYATDAIFSNLFNTYSQMHKAQTNKRKKVNAKRA